MSVRAKFKVDAVEKNADGYGVTLRPVVGGSAENDTFFRYTPWGQIQIGTVNPAAGDQFNVGDEFYVDFTKAE
jgi:hypothetical protein